MYRNSPGGDMKLFEKLAFKAGVKFGTAVYGGNLSAEEKRQLERRLYQEKLQEEKRAAAARRSSGSSYRPRECCANCFYFSDFMGQYCTEHQYAFTTSEEVNNVKYERVCSSYRPNR